MLKFLMDMLSSPRSTKRRSMRGGEADEKKNHINMLVLWLPRQKKHINRKDKSNS